MQTPPYLFGVKIEKETKDDEIPLKEDTVA
jgi:hypothetical protein